MVDVAPFLDKNLSTSARLSWLFVYSTAFALCGSICYQLASSYMQSPFMMSVEAVEDGLSEEVFPAVTICNIRKWLAPSYEESEMRVKVAWVKSRMDMALPHCSWKSTSYKCDELLRPVLTDLETFCYSFNYGSPEKYADFYSKSGSNLNEANQTLIKTPRGLSISNGLSVVFDLLRKDNGVHERFDLISLKRECWGYMVLVHHPDEFPMMAGPSMHITAGFENNFKIEIIKFSTSPSVKSHPVASRHKNCYFDGERSLTFFNVYSVSACRMECILNMTIAVCGCYHWTTPGWPANKRCSGDNDTLCHTRIVDGLQRNEEPEFVDHWRQCECMTRCTYTTYRVTSSYAMMDAASMADTFNKTFFYARFEMAILNVFFGDTKVMVYRRDVLSTISNLCSNIGGILGSILGWSLISVVRLLFSILFNVKRVVTQKKPTLMRPRPHFIRNKR